MAEVRISAAVLIVDDYGEDGAKGNFRPTDATFLVPRQGRSFRAATEADAIKKLNSFLGGYGLPPLSEQKEGALYWVRDPDQDGEKGRYDMTFVGDSSANPDENGKFFFDLSMWIETLDARPLIVEAHSVKCSWCNDTKESTAKDRHGEYLPCEHCSPS